MGCWPLARMLQMMTSRRGPWLSWHSGIEYRIADAFEAINGHRAGLNFGDVFSYALAKVRHLPPLYKGNDFAETDLQPAAPNPVGLRRGHIVATRCVLGSRVRRTSNSNIASIGRGTTNIAAAKYTAAVAPALSCNHPATAGPVACNRKWQV
jgi:hypothetical protein